MLGKYIWKEVPPPLGEIPSERAVDGLILISGGSFQIRIGRLQAKERQERAGVSPGGSRGALVVSTAVGGCATACRA